MAVVNGKRYFPWVQCLAPYSLDPNGGSALSNWQLAVSQTNPAISQTKTNPKISVSLCFRGGFSIGGRP